MYVVTEHLKCYILEGEQSLNKLCNELLELKCVESRWCFFFVFVDFKSKIQDFSNSMLSDVTAG